MLSLPEAIDVTAAALALNRGIVAPAEVARHGPLWILRDSAPKPGKARTEEIFAYGAGPDEVVRALRDYRPRGKYALEPFIGPDEDMAEAKAAYKALGFRLVRSEPLFVCTLENRKPAASPWCIRRVGSLEEARAVSLQIFGRASRKVRPEDLETPAAAIRMYWVDVEGEAVAVARSLMPGPTATWMHDVETRPEFRRRGIGRALLDHILADDALHGSEHSVLLATQAGSRLYPHVGYQQRALLQIYNPAPTI